MGKSIYDLSWGETSFLAKMQLFFKARKYTSVKLRSSDLYDRAEGYTSLSSTYYSISGTAVARLRSIVRLKWYTLFRIAAWCIAWLPLAAWCYWRMLPLSDRALELLGYDGMTTDQCDVRQSILRRRGRYAEAEECIRIALTKQPASAASRGLLHVGMAQIYKHRRCHTAAKVEVRLALAEIEIIERKDPRQAVRIYRHCASILDAIGVPSSHLRSKGQAIAREADAQDQLLKLG